MKNFWLKWAEKEDKKEMRKLAQVTKGVIEDRFHQFHCAGSMDYKTAYQLAAKKGREFLQMLKDNGSIYAGKIRHSRQGMAAAVKKELMSPWVWSDEAILKPHH